MQAPANPPDRAAGCLQVVFQTPLALSQCCSVVRSQLLQPRIDTDERGSDESSFKIGATALYPGTTLRLRSGQAFSRADRQLPRLEGARL